MSNEDAAHISEKINIAFFHIDGEFLGGGSKMLIRLLEDLDTDRFNPLLVVQSKGVTYKHLNEKDIEVVVIPYKGVLDTHNKGLLSKSPVRLSATSARILQYNSETRRIFDESDIIWCENLRVVLTLLPNIFLSSAKVIWNIGLGLESEGIFKYLNSAALRAVDRVFIESDKQAQRIFTNRQYQKYKSKSASFHKGIDTTTFSPYIQHEGVSNGDFLVGTAASLTPRKGLEFLIEGFAQFKDGKPEASLLIAGEAPENHNQYKTKLETQISNYNLENDIHFLGWVDDMPKFLSDLDVFVLSSLNEGVPGAVREALAMELPVIATDVGGTSEVVLNKETGILIKPKDSEEISKALNYIYNNSQEAEQMARNGRKHVVRNFSTRSYVDNYEDLFIEIVS